MIVFLKCRVRMRFSGVVADRNTTWCHSEITIVSGQLEFPRESCTALWASFDWETAQSTAKEARERHYCRSLIEYQN